MLIRLNRLHARSLRESRRDSDGVIITRYQAELQNNEGDLSLILKGIPTDEASVMAEGFIAGKQYDVTVTVKEHVESQTNLVFEVRGEGSESGDKAPADDDLPEQLRPQPKRRSTRRKSA